MNTSTRSCYHSMIIIALFVLLLNASSFAGIHTITFTCCAYTPNSLSVSVGDTIQWTGDFAFHPLSSTAVPTGAQTWHVASGTFFQYKVSLEGTYNYACDIHGGTGMTGSFTATVTDITERGETGQLIKFKLGLNYPNPFNPTTDIRYQIADGGFVSLKIFDVLGREVSTLVNEVKYPGTYTVNWDANGLPGGVYFYRLQAGDFMQARKLILTR